MSKILNFKIQELDNGFVLDENGETTAKNKLGNVKGAISIAIEKALEREFPNIKRRKKLVHVKIEVVDDIEIPKEENSNDNKLI